MNPLIVLIIAGAVFLALSKFIGKIVEALVGTAAIVAILYGILKYFGRI